MCASNVNLAGLLFDAILWLLVILVFVLKCSVPVTIATGSEMIFVA